MIIIREFNEVCDGYSTKANENYRIVRDRIKRYWANRNGTVLTTKKTKTKDYTYCTYTVRIEY